MKLNAEKMVERFIRYATFDTQSDASNSACPSTDGQRVFAAHLAEELNDIGLADVMIDENGYITATLEATPGEETRPVIGFISHLDTSPDIAGAPVKPRLVKNYPGGDIILSQALNIILSPQEFPELTSYTGQDLLVTDGQTLLGADDKAGICAIVSAAEYLLQHPEIPHGKIRMGFTPDEEIARSADRFDVAAFGADFAYTVDGGALGGIEYENFNAATAEVTIHGRIVHPGSAKGKMINALTIAAEWQQFLPAGQRPEYTAGHEGFFHVNKLSGSVEHATMNILVRDHDRKSFEQRKALLESMAQLFNQRYGAGTISLKCHDSYYNMREKIESVMEIIDLASEAMRAVGIEPIFEPIRGGTDGARLSFMGLPCPNLFTGGHNFHGKYEFLPVPSLQKAGETVIEIIARVRKA
ncbi:MAG: peptidase T [Selenomonadaceae bacterium]